jgi:hypothetical protein
VRGAIVIPFEPPSNARRLEVAFDAVSFRLLGVA